MLPWYYCDNSFCDRPFFPLTAIFMPSLFSPCLPGMTTTSSLHLVFFLTTLFACLSYGTFFEQLLLLTKTPSSSPAFASEVSLQKYLLLWIVCSIQHMMTMETKNTNLETRKKNCKQVCALSYNLDVSGDTVGYWLEYFTGLISSPN